MEFMCGKTEEQKLRDSKCWALKEMRRMKRWSKWKFAWLPMTVDDTGRESICIWLSRYRVRFPDVFVEKRRFLGFGSSKWSKEWVVVRGTRQIYQLWQVL